MRGGELGRIFLLAFLLFHAGVRADDSQVLGVSVKGDDQNRETKSQKAGDHQLVESKPVDSALAEEEEVSDERSSAFAQSVSSGGSAKSLAQATGDASANAQALSQTHEGHPVPSPYNQYGAQPTDHGSGLPGYYSSSASASAEALADTGSPVYPSQNYPNSVYPQSPVESSASASAQAQENAGLSGNPTYPFPSHPSQSFSAPDFAPGNSASALANAKVNTGHTGLQSFPRYPSFPIPGYPGGLSGSSASAKAQAESNTNQYVFPNYPGSESPENAASALALAKVLADNFSGNTDQNLPSYPGYSKNPSGSSASALAEADAESQGGQYPGQGYPYNEASAQAIADTKANAYGTGLTKADAVASAQANTGSRLIPTDELITENPDIQCAYAGQLHYYWSSQYQCSVCACVSEYGLLKPVCASCAGCMRPPRPPPLRPTTPLPPPLPPPPPSPLPPLPPPAEPQVLTCDPLPTNKPFQNPLNPCQICICTHTINNIGKPDVQIICKDNPQCVLPPDTTELPPSPVPIPQSKCGRFPPNVWFPHPNDVCQVCQCTIQQSPMTGEPENLITCVPSHACQPVNPTEPPAPRPPPTPRPLPTPRPPLPMTTQAPFPWPPTPTPPPSPLPGPKPHESCRPFQPNVPFDHPWDSCQLCVCTEAFKVGFVNVELNCYTKKECCIEPPYPPLPHQGKAVVTRSSAGAHASASAQANAISNLNHPVSSPNQSTRPVGPNYPIGPSNPTGPSYLGTGAGAGSSASALAEAATSGSLHPYYGPGYPQRGQSGFIPGKQGEISSAQAKAQAEANSNQYGLVPEYYPSLGTYGLKSSPETEAQLESGGYSSAQAQADAVANAYGVSESAQAQAQAQAEANANLNGPRIRPYSAAEAQAATRQYGAGGSLYSAAQAQSLAEANAKQYAPRASPYSEAGDLSQAEVNAKLNNQAIPLAGARAQALAEPAANHYGGRVRPYSSVEAQAQAEASLNQIGQGNVVAPADFRYDLNNGYEPVPISRTFGTLTREAALANAESASEDETGFSGRDNNYPFSSVPASALYPKLYQRPSSQMTPFYNKPGLRNGNIEGAVIRHGDHLHSVGAEQALLSSGSSRISTGERCAYDGDKYEHHCQACECHSGPDGVLVAFCSGVPCVY